MQSYRIKYRWSLFSLAGVACIAVFVFLQGRWSGSDYELQVVDAGVIDADTQRPGQPALGKQALLTRDYVSCGIPARVYRRLSSSQNEPGVAVDGRSADLPYFLNATINEEGVELVVSNCLSCHAAPLFGELVVGLGNEFIDFADQRELVEQAGLYVRGAAEERAWRKTADRFGTLAPYITPATRGVNTANNLTYALMAHMEPTTLQWSAEPGIEPPHKEPLPVSVPPWWRMKKKHAMFYQGQARGDHARFMMLAALLCADGIDDARRTEDYAADIRAYIASLEPPAYPFTIDQTAAATGERVFQRHCSHCHGRYGEEESYPNLLVALDVVGTDPELALEAIAYSRFAEWTSRSYFGEDTATVAARGYMAPPLDGIWATAPFLHNGSVPTLELVLKSSQRPARWRHIEPRKFDQRAIGWQWQPAEKSLSPDRTVYDTARRGYGNGGHRFGDTLTDLERAALLEYLKTL